MRVIRRWAVNSPHKGPVTHKKLPFGDVTMNIGCIYTRTNIFSITISPNQAVGNRQLTVFFYNACTMIHWIYPKSYSLTHMHLYSVKIRKKYIYRSDTQLLSSFFVLSSPSLQMKLHLLSSLFINGFPTPSELWNSLNKALPGKFYGSGGHSKRQCLQDQANVRRSRAWQYVIILTFSLYIYTYILTTV